MTLSDGLRQWLSGQEKLVLTVLKWTLIGIFALVAIYAVLSEIFG